MATKKIRIRDSSDNLQRQLDVDDTTAKLHVYDSSDNDLGSLELVLNPSFGTETTVSVAASSTSVISKGVYYARADSGVNIEYSTDGGTTWVALSAPALIISDGSNVRFNNTNSSAANGYLVQIS